MKKASSFCNMARATEILIRMEQEANMVRKETDKMQTHLNEEYWKRQINLCRFGESRRFMNCCDKLYNVITQTLLQFISLIDEWNWARKEFFLIQYDQFENQYMTIKDMVTYLDIKETFLSSDPDYRRFEAKIKTKLKRVQEVWRLLYSKVSAREAKLIQNFIIRDFGIRVDNLLERLRTLQANLQNYEMLQSTERSEALLQQRQNCVEETRRIEDEFDRIIEAGFVLIRTHYFRRDDILQKMETVCDAMDVIEELWTRQYRGFVHHVGL